MSEDFKLASDPAEPPPAADDLAPPQGQEAEVSPGSVQDPVQETESVSDSPAPIVQPRLVVKRAGIETDEVFPFACPAVIGRFDPSVGPIDIDLGPIEEGTYVSRKHARIIEEDGAFKIVDLGSSNGTYINREGDFQRVDEAEIHSGDEIALGNARLVFYT